MAPVDARRVRPAENANARWPPGRWRPCSTGSTRERGRALVRLRRRLRDPLHSCSGGSRGTPSGDLLGAAARRRALLLLRLPRRSACADRPPPPSRPEAGHQGPRDVAHAHRRAPLRGPRLRLGARSRLDRVAPEDPGAPGARDPSPSPHRPRYARVGGSLPFAAPYPREARGCCGFGGWARGSRTSTSSGEPTSAGSTLSIPSLLPLKQEFGWTTVRRVRHPEQADLWTWGWWWPPPSRGLGCRAHVWQTGDCPGSAATVPPT